MLWCLVFKGDRDSFVDLLFRQFYHYADISRLV